MSSFSKLFVFALRYKAIATIGEVERILLLWNKIGDKRQNLKLRENQKLFEAVHSSLCESVLKTSKTIYVGRHFDKKISNIDNFMMENMRGFL